MNRISKSLVIGVVLLLALAVVPVAFADHTEPEYEGTQVHRYEQEFQHWTCIPRTDWWADIPAYFAEREGEAVDVCVFYQGWWTETLIVKEPTDGNDFGDVRWSANIVGTATFYRDEDGEATWGCGSEGERPEAQPEWMTACTEVLTVARFKQDEVGRDIGGDAECLFLAEPTWEDMYGAAQAEMGSCWENNGVGGGDDLYREGKLEFLNLQQKITFDDEVVIYTHLAIHGFFPADENGKIYTKWCAWSDMVSMGTYCFEE